MSVCLRNIRLNRSSKVNFNFTLQIGLRLLTSFNNKNFCFSIYRGQLGRGLELFRKAIQLAQTENELAHLYSLHDAAEAQSKVVERLGIQMGFNAENE